MANISIIYQGFKFLPSIKLSLPMNKSSGRLMTSTDCGSKTLTNKGEFLIGELFFATSILNRPMLFGINSPEYQFFLGEIEFFRSSLKLTSSPFGPLPNKKLQ